MSGQWTRSWDDNCFINSRNIQSDAPYRYQVYMGQQKNCHRCMPTFGGVPTGQWFDSRDLKRVDIESVLKNQSYPHIGCGRDNYRGLNIYRENKDLDNYCGKWLTPMDTLMSHPKEYYKELQIDRFYDFSGMRPNENYLTWDFATDSRLQAKDGFVQRYPTPISVNMSLPSSQRSSMNNWN